MNKLRLCVIVGICGVLFSGCELFKQISADTSKWGGDTASKSTAKGNDCVPSDFRQRVEKYKKQYKNDDKMYLKVSSLIGESKGAAVFDHSDEMYFNKQEMDRYGLNWSDECSTYIARAYAQIIKENGVPKSYKEELAFIKKVKIRAIRLFDNENPNETFHYQ